MYKAEEKLKLILKDLKGFNPKDISPIYGFKNILIRQFDPPAYIVRLILLEVLKLKDYGKMDKVWWYTYFEFNGFEFMINDYKFGSWTIKANCHKKYISREFIKGPNEKKGILIEKIIEDSDLYKTSLMIRSKLKKAAKLLITDFKEIHLDDEKIENYYIHNTYKKLEAIFLFFKTKLREIIQKYNNFLAKKDNIVYRKKYMIKYNEGTPSRKIVDVMGDPLIKILNEFDFPKEMIDNHKNKIDDGKVMGNFSHDKYPVIKGEIEKEISNYSFALISIFFSLLEFLLETFYLFQERKMGLKEFKSMHWTLKFKYIFPIQSINFIKKIYDSFREVKSKYRNPLNHGLLNEINYLVPFPPYGLKPISYEYLTDKIHYRYIQISINEAIEIEKIFQNFLDNYLKKTEPYNYYMLYLNFYFPIPINYDEIIKIKDNMTNLKDFLEYLLERDEYEDAVINREI